MPSSKKRTVELFINPYGRIAFALSLFPLHIKIAFAILLKTGECNSPQHDILFEEKANAIRRYKDLYIINPIKNKLKQNDDSKFKRIVDL